MSRKGKKGEEGKEFLRKELDHYLEMVRETGRQIIETDPSSIPGSPLLFIIELAYMVTISLVERECKKEQEEQGSPK